MIAPPGSVCAEPECQRAPTTTRPETTPMLTGSGVVTDYDLWVCAEHCDSESRRKELT